MSLNFKRMFDAHADGNKRVWQHDRSKTVGASESFQCIRRNWFTKHGAKHDADFKESYGATTRGSLMEAHYVVPAITGNLPSDATALWMGDDQVTLVKGRLSATPDGLITGLPRDALKEYGVEDIESDCILVEIKSFDPRLDLKEPKPVHAGQAQQQMGLTHEATNHRPEYTVILYVNASWLDDIRPFVVKRDPAVYAAAKKRADLVFDSKEPTDLPPEGKITGGAECAYCPFQRRCSLAQTGSVPVEKGSGTVAAKDEIVLKGMVQRHSAAHARIGELEKDKAAASEEIKQFLRDQGRRFAKTGDGFSVSYTVAPGRKSYDMDRIALDTGIDLDDYVEVGDPSERLTVKAPKE